MAHYDYKGKQRTKPDIGLLNEVTGPNILSMIVQKCLPGRARRSRQANLAQVFENGTLADLQAQLTQFTTYPFCAPQAVLYCHAFDKCDDLG